MTENVENIITFAPVEGNKPFGIIIDKDPEFLLVKLELIISTEQHLSITLKYVRGNSEVKIEE